MERDRVRQSFQRSTLSDFCKAVAKPELPSPTGGAVIGVVGAMLASLTELVALVSQNHEAHRDIESQDHRIQKNMESQDDNKMQNGGFNRTPIDWDPIIQQTRELNEKLLRFAEEDVWDTYCLLEGKGPACVRKQMAAPAKIASAVMKILQLTEKMAEHADKSMHPDLRIIAHLGRGAADAIFEIEQSDMEWNGGGDDLLVTRIAQWRDRAHTTADQILHKVRGSQWQK